MTEIFIQNATTLSEVLTKLVCQQSEDNTCCTTVFEPENILQEDDNDQKVVDNYQVTLVPPHTKHPLNHIVTSSDQGFFLVGKAVVDAVVNEDGEEGLHLSTVELSRVQTERVLVGTPISQQVVFMNGTAALHQGSAAATRRVVSSRSQSCVTEWRLYNVLAMQPVTLDKARYLISLFDYCLANGLFDLGLPLWVIVDEKNTAAVTHIATLPSSLQTDRILHHVVITSKGLYSKPTSLPTINDIKTLHDVKCLGALLEDNSYAYALYELLGVSHSLDDDQKSSAYVEFTWKDVHCLLQPPPLTSDCILHIKCLPGTMQLPTFSLAGEVNKLSCFCGMIDDPEQPWPEMDCDDVEEVQHKMAHVLESLSAGEGYPQHVPDSNDSERSSLLSPQVQLSLQEFVPRKDLDFIESLWLVLKEAVHFDDLTASLQIVLNTLLSGACQPVIHTTNKTHLAIFIRELLQCETNEQRHKLRLKVDKMLDYDVALKCLVGIGAEKLLRDHTNYFLSEELVTQDQLKFYMDDKVALKEKVHRVSMLQNVLDLVLTTKCVVNTGHSNLQLLTQAALVYYENHDAANHPIFSLPLPAYGASSASAVKSIISNQQPTVWCLALKSKSKRKTLMSVLQLSTESPFHATTDFLDEEAHDKEDDVTLSLTSQIPYYLCHAKQSVVPLVPSQY